MGLLTRDGMFALARLVEVNRPTWEHGHVLSAIHRVVAARGKDTSANTISIGFLAVSEDLTVDSPTSIPSDLAYWEWVGSSFLVDADGRRYANKRSREVLAAAKRDQVRPDRAAQSRGFLAASAQLRARHEQQHPHPTEVFEAMG